MNHNGSLLRTLYHSASAKYLKLKGRMEKARQSGKFYTLSRGKQHSLIQRLNKLFERLKSLQTQLRLSGIGAAIALAVSVTDVNAQSGLGPFERNDPDNPLPPPIRLAVPKPISVDIDNDGDLDVFVGDKYGNIHFFRNTGGKDVVRRLYQEEDHPLDFVSLADIASPAFIDIDADGDFDLLVGTTTGYTYFFRNIGSATNAQFEEQIGASNPFDGITGSITKYGNRGPALPTFADLDGDADLDLIVGSSFIYDNKYSYAPAVKIYHNTAGEFTIGDASGFNDLTYGNRRSLTFVDLDGDEDLDVLAGAQNGNPQTFLNIGGVFFEQYGPWNAITHTGNPLYSAYLSGNVWMNLADLDDDGDLDLLAGTGFNYSTADNTNPISFFENVGDFVFEQRNGLNLSPFDGVDVSEQATPSFSDIDGDGDIDAILGSKYSFRLSIYKNTDGFLVQDEDHPLSDVNVFNNTTPVFVDIDDDGDQDLFVTSGYNHKFFQNNNSTFAQTTSPLDLSSFERPSLAFIDVDNDTDFDALVFDEDSRKIEFLRNVGTASNPQFQSQTAPAPFNTLTFDDHAKLSSTDIDHDGDLDLVVSESVSSGYSYYTRFRLFDHASNNSFSEITPTPFTTDFEIQGSMHSFLNLADFDGDGDLDLFVGYGRNQYEIEGGTVGYYENENPPPVTMVIQSSVSVSLNSPVHLDPDLNIEDNDDDDIVLARVAISNFSEDNEVLDFTPSAGVAGEFEDGVLTITGKATLQEYETILRSVTYEATGNVTGARQAGRAGVPPQKTVTFTVRDIDFTETVVSQVSVISLNVTDEPAVGIVVYNAVSPDVSEGQNDYMRITGLPANNKVTIFNRWGDKVFEISKYDNDIRRFEGKNDNGKDLPSGTYFYEIIADGKTLTGYLSLKR